MLLLLMVVGIQPRTTASYGLRGTLGRIGSLILTDAGSGRITDGLGFLMNHEAGLHFIMEGGYT